MAEVFLDPEGMGFVLAVDKGDGDPWTYPAHIEPEAPAASAEVATALAKEIMRLHNLSLSAEQIKTLAGFSLIATFTEFADNQGLVSPELHEERERIAEEYGEDNVLPSFYREEDGTLQLGLFLRLPG